jgi:hypothetical protein
MLDFMMHGSYVMYETPIPDKPSFALIFQQSHTDYDTLIEVAASTTPKVPESIIKDMLAGRPVMAVHAQAILNLLSIRLGRVTILTLDTVNMPLLREKGDVTDVTK